VRTRNLYVYSSDSTSSLSVADGIVPMAVDEETPVDTTPRPRWEYLFPDLNLERDLDAVYDAQRPESVVRDTSDPETLFTSYRSIVRNGSERRQARERRARQMAEQEPTSTATERLAQFRAERERDRYSSSRPTPRTRDVLASQRRQSMHGGTNSPLMGLASNESLALYQRIRERDAELNALLGNTTSTADNLLEAPTQQGSMLDRIRNRSTLFMNELMDITRQTEETLAENNAARMRSQQNTREFVDRSMRDGHRLTRPSTSQTAWYDELEETTSTRSMTEEIAELDRRAAVAIAQSRLARERARIRREQRQMETLGISSYLDTYRHRTQRSVDLTPPQTQLEQDEALARRLQEEELATTNLYDTDSVEDMGSLYSQVHSWRHNPQRLAQRARMPGAWEDFRRPSRDFNVTLSSLDDLGRAMEQTFEELVRLEDRLGRVSRGLSESQLAKLTSIPCTTDHVDQDCTVCLASFEVQEQLRQLPCNHYFHVACIDTWLSQNHTCPVCRGELSTTL
jgi:hypothetical protein